MPIKLIKIAFGQKKVIPNEAKVLDFLAIGNFEKARLTNLFIKEKIVKSKRDKINYIELAQEYRKFIETGSVKNKAELARKLSVSRAWITKVLKIPELIN